MTDDRVSSKQRRRSWTGGLLLWLHRRTLRTKLLSAFFALILVSSTATVVIASQVFGKQIYGLAYSEMEVGLNVADMLLAEMKRHFETTAKERAKALAKSDASEDLCVLLWQEEMGVDFIIKAGPRGVTLVHGSYSPTDVFGPGGSRGWDNEGLPSKGPLTRGCRGVSLEGDAVSASPLVSLGEHMRSSQRVTSGFYVLSGELVRKLKAGGLDGEGLFIIAAAPLSGEGVLFVGASLVDRREFLERPLRILKTGQRRWYEASLFLRGVRVATTIKKGGIGSRVDESVLREVLVRGKRFVGTASVIGEEFYTAYMPLVDHQGTPVGMIGFGAKRQMYVDMRNATTLAFALLIAVGVLFGFFTTYLFTHWIIQPVASLAKGMDRVARGDLDHKVRIESADELGRLVKSFNLMVKKIKEREIRLQQISEERMSIMEKQVSIGRLAAGVAHEINNPLTSVLSLSMLMKDALGPDDPHAEDLAVIVEETTRCRKIVRDLLDFARQAPMEKGLVDINAVIQETLSLVSRYEAMEGVQLSLDLSSASLHVQGDAKRLQQVFTNLISNAADACAGKGEVRISTDDDSSGGYVVVKVADNGPGIPSDQLDRVFDPFFTTKDSGQGTGLGLAVSLGIIRDHNGSIDLESKEGKGVTVTIQLPRHGGE